MIKSRRMKWTGHVAQIRGGDAYRVLVEKPKGKRPLGRYKCRWEHIKIMGGHADKYKDEH
jgi:hypothetical protein